MPQIDVARVVVTYGSEVLLLDRVPHDKIRGGDADIPGGKVDGDEEGDVAAARELWEETGIRVDPANLLPVPDFEEVKDDRHGKLLIKAVFWAVLEEKPKIVTDPREHTGGAFYSREAAREKFTHDLYARAVERVFESMNVGVAPGAA